MELTHATLPRAAKTPASLFSPRAMSGEIFAMPSVAMPNVHKSSGFGLPCSNCRLYYPANLDTCPACNSKERVSPVVIRAIPIRQPATDPAADAAMVEQQREAFLKEFKSSFSRRIRKSPTHRRFAPWERIRANKPRRPPFASPVTTNCRSAWMSSKPPCTWT